MLGHERVETSCGCAAAVPSKGPIAPGKKEIIRVTMTPPVANPITKHIIDIQTNDPKAKHIRLAIKADVWAPMTFSPKRVILTGPRGQEISRVARVDFDRRIKLEGIEVDYDKKVLNVDFERIAERRLADEAIRESREFTRAKVSARISGSFLKMKRIAHRARLECAESYLTRHPSGLAWNRLLQE